MSLAARPVAHSGAAVITVITVSHFVNDTFTSLFGPLQPSIAARFDVTLSDTGTLVAIASFVGSMLQPLFGAVGDRIDRRYLAAMGPMLAGLGMCLLGLAPSFAALGLLIAVAGIGSAVFHPSGAAYIAANATLHNRGLYASIFSAGGTAGLALGPLISQALGLDNLIYLLPIGVVMGLISFMLTPSTKNLTAAKPSSLQDYLAIFQGPIRMLWAVSVLRSLSTVAYASLIPFVFAENGWAEHTGPALAVFSLASALGGIVGGQISDRIGRTTVLRSSVLGLIPLFVGLIYSNPEHWWYYPLGFLVGSIANATIPVAVVAAQEYAPGHTATTSALMMGFSWGTAGVLYKPISELAEMTTPEVAMLVTVGLLLPALWLSWRLPEPARAVLEK
jgi:MFS transporter, FSR family, fosmidomycin resistance protein